MSAEQKDANLVELEKCCQTHIFLQNFVLIQPRTSLVKFARSPRSKRGIGLARMRGRHDERPRRRPDAAGEGGESPERRPAVVCQRASVGKISGKCCSFSAVSAPIFARKYAFCSIFQNLPDSQAEIFKI